MLSEFLLTRLCEARPADAGLRFCSFSYFYSRASARRDGTDWVATYREVLFLLTRLCEARLTCASLYFSYYDFYSRASARRDELLHYGIS